MIVSLFKLVYYYNKFFVFSIKVKQKVCDLLQEQQSISTLLSSFMYNHKGNVASCFLMSSFTRALPFMKVILFSSYSRDI